MCRVDMAYDGVVVELDGHLGHDSTGGKFRDMDRDNAVAVGGRFVLRFGWADVHERPCGVARQVSGVAGIPARRCGRRCAAATGTIAA
jgi:very-short-patch-repair endonuclease